MNIFWAAEVDDDWAAIRTELERAFVFARGAATKEESFVFVVNTNDLLGRRGPGNAMVATGLLSAARTAALEGTRKGWTANVLAWDGNEDDRALVDVWAAHLLETSGITGEVVRVGPGHIGKALP